MSQEKNSLIVIIPAYEPRKEFVDYAKIVCADAMRLIVVNDGSCEKYDPIFDEIAKIENVTYLKHEQNKGKGCALKTAIKYCAENFEDSDVIVTADCDGQHATEDVVKVYEAVLAHKDNLVLGSRDFTLENIPPKSQLGNSMFRNAYKFFYRLEVYDTQTGLRGFTVELAKELLEVKGKRFEYEMSVLIYAKKSYIPILEVPIRTIYPDNPKDHVTHYRPIVDGMRIFGVVFKNIGAKKRPRNPKKA